MLRRTCAQIRSWQERGLAVPVLAVNLSARQFDGGGLHEQLCSILAEYGVQARQIELEITEDAALSNTAELLDLLHQLREQGFSIAIDDFGTGYSSLSYLTSLPATTLKIDRAFINRIKEDTRRDSVVEAVIALGHMLGMLVVAEGVENEVQLDFLRGAGCDVVQGFYLGRPQSAQAIVALLERCTAGDGRMALA
ncbi:Oxygen sensor protein DosP [compost metagenome]